MVSLQVIVPLLNIILGTVFLFFGRRFFWLIVGLIGFVIGVNIAGYYFAGQPDWVILLAGIFFGFLGILLATYLEHIAITIVGGLAGGSLLAGIYLNLLQGPENHTGLAFIIGAIIGGLTFIYFFDWTLILFSALLGALLITQAFNLGSIQPWVFLALFVIGVVVQIRAVKQTPVQYAD